MEYNNFKKEEHMGRLTVSYLVGEERYYDSISARVVQKYQPGFLPPCKIGEKNGKPVITYNIGSYLSLQYFKADLPANMYIKLFKSVVQPMLNCSDWFIQPSQLCTAMEYVYIDKVTYEVKYLYVPEYQDEPSYAPLKDLVRQMASSCTCNGDEKASNAIFKYLMQDRFHPEEFLQVLDAAAVNLNGTASAYAQPSAPAPMRPAPAPKPAPAPVPPVPSAPIHKPEPVVPVTPPAQEHVSYGKPNPGAAATKPLSARDAIAQELAMSDMSPKSPKKKKEKAPSEPLLKKMGLSFGKKKQDAEIPMEQYSASTPASQPMHNVSAGAINNYMPDLYYGVDEDDVTEIPRAKPTAAKGCYLQRVGNHNGPVQIVLPANFQRFSIGRTDRSGKTHKDFEFDSDIRAISRDQAMIQKSANGTYTIVDLGSGNGTYVNSQRITMNVEREIHSGDVIGFSDKGYDYQLVLG